MVKALAAVGKEALDKDKATDAAKAAVEQALKTERSSTQNGWWKGEETVQVLQEKAKGIQQILSCTQMQCSSTS
jgi:hypothetical protein